MWRKLTGAVLVAASVLAASEPSSALEMPKRQTFPYLDQEFRVLDQQAFDIASGQSFEEIWTQLGEQAADDEAVLRQKSGAHRELAEVLTRLREGVATKYGENSREMQDMYRREAQLHR